MGQSRDPPRATIQQRRPPFAFFQLEPRSNDRLLRRPLKRSLLALAAVTLSLCGCFKKTPPPRLTEVTFSTPVRLEVDPRPFQAIVDQAAAQLNVANAGLTQATADVAAAKAEIDRAEAAQLKTELDVKRYSPLAKDGTVSQQELGDAVQSNLANLASVASAKGKYDHTKAAVTAAEAQIGVARSSLQAAELNLAFTKVKSPVNGIAGIRAANIKTPLSNRR
jgi:hypothetical protein